MTRIRRGRSTLALALLVGVLACGRTPVWLPCGTPEGDDDVPAPSCEHPACRESTTARLTLPPTNALIVLDRSCSMAVVTDGRTKWDRAVEAVSAMVTDPRAQWLRWGLTLFPDGDTDGVQGPILVPVAPGQAEIIADLLQAALDRNDPNHPNQPGEPCFTNLAAAVDQFASSDAFGRLDGRSHVILITDGLAGAEEQISLDLAELFDRDIPTFVVGFGERVDHSVLQSLGEAGGVPASGETAYYRAELDDLGGALSQVVSSLRCRHALRLRPEDVELLEVRTDDGVLVPRDDSGAEGWRYDPSTEALSFAGQACEQLLAGRITTIELALDCG